MISVMFAGLKGVQLQVFLDDVCLASKTWQEHLILLDQCLKIVIKNKLKLKTSKCVFGVEDITFLGHKVSKDGVTQDPDKLRAFSDLPVPTNLSEVRRILGAFGYYRRFVYKFSTIAEPIIQLTRKDATFRWGPEQDNAFRKLKEKLLKNATLSHFTPGEPTMLKTDASKEGLAGMLLQQRDGDWKLVCCVSRRLSQAERNYSVTEMEGLAVVYCVQKLRPFLLGQPFVILTDHCALCSLGKKMSQNSRLRRWALVLSEFDFKIEFRKGTAHCDVDCLSRSPVCDEHEEFLERILVLNPLPVPINPQDWTDAYTDDETRKFLNEAEDGSDRFILVDGLLYFEQKLYVPDQLRPRILRENHDLGAAAHDGIGNTIYRLRHFWWPRLAAHVKQYVQQCTICQLRKAKRTRPHGTMQPHRASYPLETLAFDHIGPWQATISNKRFVCVGVDVFSRFIFAKAMEDQSGALFADYLTELMALIGIPKHILTDNSKAFDNARVRTIEAEHGIVHKFSTPHHSQGNAVVERAIESLEKKLGLVQQETNCDWEQAIPIAVLSLNSRRSRTTTFAPFELMFNRTNGSTAASLLKTMSQPLTTAAVNETRAKAIEATANAHSRSKRRYDNSHQPTVFEVGSTVMSKRSSRRAKLSNRYEGPYKIISRIKDIYTIKHEASGQVLKRHVSQLERFHPEEGDRDPPIHHRD